MLLAHLAFLASAGAPEPSLAEAEELLADNRVWDAYSLLNRLIPADPPFPAKALLLRARCAHKMLHLNEVIDDCSSVIDSADSDPRDIRAARRLRGASFLKLGDFDSAVSDALSADDRKVQHRVARARALLAEAERSEGGAGRTPLDRLLRLAPKAVDAVERRADLAWEEGDHRRFVRAVRAIVDDFPGNAVLNYRTGVALLCLEDLEGSPRYFARAENGTAALQAVAELRGLRDGLARFLDEDEWGPSRDALDAILRHALLFCPVAAPLVQNATGLLVEMLRIVEDKEALVDALGQLIEADGFNLSLRMERANLNMELGNYDSAVYDFNFVKTQDPDNAEAAEGYDRAFEARKEATRVDYYAALELTSSATQGEIHAAYRRMARLWHPDRFGDTEEKEHAHAVMRLVNEAHEVLGDPDKRKAYDDGEDWEGIGIEDLLKSEPSEQDNPL
jgi:tetratricopeptide (TPR) repeat protein